MVGILIFLTKTTRAEFPDSLSSLDVTNASEHLEASTDANRPNGGLALARLLFVQTGQHEMPAVANQTCRTGF